MSEEMTMRLMDGVLVRSYHLAEDDDRLARGVDTAQQIAANYGHELKSADIDPVADDEGTLRIHAEGKSQGFIAISPPSDERGVVRSQVYCFPVLSDEDVLQILAEQPDIPDDERERLIREYKEGRGSGER